MPAAEDSVRLELRQDSADRRLQHSEALQFREQQVKMLHFDLPDSGLSEKHSALLAAVSVPAAMPVVWQLVQRASVQPDLLLHSQPLFFPLLLREVSIAVRL